MYYSIADPWLILGLGMTGGLGWADIESCQSLYFLRITFWPKIFTKLHFNSKQSSVLCRTSPFWYDNTCSDSFSLGLIALILVSARYFFRWPYWKFLWPHCLLMISVIPCLSSHWLWLFLPWRSIISGLLLQRAAWEEDYASTQLYLICYLTSFGCFVTFSPKPRRHLILGALICPSNSIWLLQC